MVGPEYLGSAGWHADNAAAPMDALRRAQHYYPWVPVEALEVTTVRPDFLPLGDPVSSIPGWLNPLAYGPDMRPHVTARNLWLTAEYQRAKRTGTEPDYGKAPELPMKEED